MKTPEQQAAVEAVGRIGDAWTVNLQIAVLQAAVRAMVVTHPEPEKFRAYFNQVLGQFMASQAVAGYPDRSVVLRDLTASLFEPPVELDTSE